MSEPTPIPGLVVTDARSAGVLFDVDGTLIDTNHLHTLAWWRALRSHGEWASMSEIHRLIGMGGDHLLPELIGRSDDAIAAAQGDHYAALAHDAVPFPGATALLTRLHDHGLQVVLASSASRHDVDAAIDLLDARAVVDAVTSADDIDRSKPSPDVLTVAMDRGGIDPERCILVGDSAWDVRSATRAGIACVALESGGTTRHELIESGALAVYADTAQLLAQIRTSPLGRLLID